MKNSEKAKKAAEELGTSWPNAVHGCWSTVVPIWKRMWSEDILPLKMEYCPQVKTCRADSDENWADLDTSH